MQSKPEARIARPGERERWRGGGAKRRGVAVAWGSAFGRVDELAHGVLGPPSVVPVGLGEGVEAPLEANDGDGEVREAGEIARQVSGSHPAAVFVVGDVAHVVESIFDAPMPAHQGQDDLRGGLVGGHGGQAVYGLVLDLAGVDDAPLALDAKGDLTMRQGGAVAVLGEVEHPAASLLDSSVSLVRGVMLGGAHLGKLPIEPSQLGEQVGAIVLDRGHHVVRAALLDQAPGGVVVGVHRVEGHDAAGEVEPGDQGTHGRDLVALVLYRLLSEDDSRAVLRSGDEPVLGARIVPGGTADVLPVDGDGVGARGLLRGPGARRAVEHIGVQVGENLDERGRGRGGEAPQTGAVERPQGTKLMLGQRLGELADCGRTVVSGKLRGDRDGQDGGQRIAPPARAAEIGHTMKTLPQASQSMGGPRSRVAFASPLWGIVEAAQLLARVAGQRVDQDLLRSAVGDPGRGRAGLVSRAERNQTKGRSKTLPPRPWG